MFYKIQVTFDAKNAAWLYYIFCFLEDHIPLSVQASCYCILNKACFGHLTNISFNFLIYT